MRSSRTKGGKNNTLHQAGYRQIKPRKLAGSAAIIDGWRTSPDGRGCQTYADGEPASEAAVYLRYLDKSPLSSGLGLRMMMALPDRATVPAAIADGWELRHGTSVPESWAIKGRFYDRADLQALALRFELSPKIALAAG